MATRSPSREQIETVASRLRSCEHSDDVERDAVLALARVEPALNADRAPGGPTRTKTIQDDYAADFYKRWRRVKGLVRETVVENDALGLRSDALTPGTPVEPQALEVNAGDPDWWAEYVVERRRGAVNASPANDFDFPQDGEKVEAFIDWLRGVFDDEVLEVVQRDGSGGVLDRNRWQNVYVRRAYGRGLKFANARLRESGLDVEGIDPAQLFNRPIHASALSRLYQRNFQELRGITAKVGQEISRELTDGLAKGWNPRKTARKLNDRVASIGLTRSRTLARTETIYAHSESTLDRYEDQLGSDAKVTGKAEWRTAGDARVCPICEGLEGTTYTIEEARGLIPIHPNCRCAWIPVVQVNNVSR